MYMKPGVGPVEGIPLAVGCQVEVIERIRALATDDRAVALVELDPHGTGDELLRVGHKGIERVLQRRVPLTVIDALGPQVLEIELGMHGLAVERDRFESLVGQNDRATGGHFVALARLHAHEPVLDHVEAAVPMFAGDLVELDDQLEQGKVLAVEGDGRARFEAELDVFGFVGGVFRIDRERPHVRRRLVVEVFEHAALDGPALQVVVDGIGENSTVAATGTLLAMAQGHFVFTGEQVPAAHGASDVDRRVERLDRVLSLHLVVALPVQPWAM